MLFILHVQTYENDKKDTINITSLSKIIESDYLRVRVLQYLKENFISRLVAIVISSEVSYLKYRRRRTHTCCRKKVYSGTEGRTEGREGVTLKGV